MLFLRAGWVGFLGWLLVGGVCAIERIPVASGDFEGKNPLADLEIEGGQAQRIDWGAKGNHALVLPRNVRAQWRVLVAPPKQVQGKKPEDGYLRLCVDVVGHEGMAAVTLRLVGEVDSKQLAQCEWRATHASGESEAVRIACHIPEKALAEREGAYRIQLQAEGKPGTSVTLDNVALERFPLHPVRAMLGKPNGVLGPDLIASGALGLQAVTEQGCHACVVLDVALDGPAAQAGLEPGDLITAVDAVPLSACDLAPGWDWFEFSHEAALGRAVERAVQNGKRTIQLTIERQGKPRVVTLEHAHARAPKDLALRGPLDERLRKDVLAWVVTHQKKNGAWPDSDVVNAALGGLALLGTHDPMHREALARCRDFLLAKNPHPSEMTGLAYWPIAFHGWFFAEYFFATGDEASRAWVEEAVLWLPTTTHESKWGTQAFGHGPDGLPYDNKALTAPTTHLLVLDALARKMGIESRIWEHVQPYMQHAWSNPDDGGHGGMGYNGSYRDKNEFWCRSGLTALAETLRGGPLPMTKPLCLFMEERHPWMLNSHAYGEPGAALGLLGLAVADRAAFERILPQWRWRFLNAWEPGYGLRWSTPHMGSPYMGEDAIVNLAYAVLGAVDSGGLVMAGGKPERWLK
ncbi:MAG TPA: PDZ domain-containing protein [Planctomycetota bacterium]|nr:PDZ domain-containing protein [Planctomycetota bacterium]